MIVAVVLIAMAAAAGGVPAVLRMRRSFGHQHYVGGNDLYCDDPHEFLQRLDGPQFPPPAPVYPQARPQIPHQVYGPPSAQPSLGHSHTTILKPVHTTVIKIRPNHGPAPLYSAQAEVYPGPGASFPAPVPSFPAPTPVYPARLPSYPAPAPVYPAPEPAYHSAPIPKPTVIGSYYEYREHKPEYYLGTKEVHRTTVDRVKVAVPITYTYTIEQPIRHTVQTYNPPTNAATHHNPPRPGLRWDPITSTWC